MKPTAEEMALYRATMQQREKKAQQKREQRRARAWETAKQAATLLKEDFGASQVVVFGSLAHGLWFSEHSDVDIAVWGLKSDDYFTAVARLQDISPEFQVDLVSIEHCKPGLREAILSEGKLL